MKIDGKTLKKYRENLNITRKDMSNLLGIAPTSINNYESNTNNISEDMKNRFIEIFGLSEYFLINDNLTDHKLDLVSALRISTLAKKIKWVELKKIEDVKLKENILKASKLLESLNPTVNNNRIILKNYNYNLDGYIKDHLVTTIGEYSYVLTSYYVKNILGDKFNNKKASAILFEIKGNQVRLINTAIINQDINKLGRDIHYSKGLWVEFSESKKYISDETKNILSVLNK